MDDDDGGGIDGDNCDDNDEGILTVYSNPCQSPAERQIMYVQLKRNQVHATIKE